MHCPNCGNDVTAKLGSRNCCTCACDQCGCKSTIVESDDQIHENAVAGSLGEVELNDENTSSTKTTIIISVRGGVVQDVFCSAAEAEVNVVDWDVGGCGEADKRHVVVPDKFGKSSPAIVSSCIAEPMRAISGTPIQLALDRAGVPCCGVQNRNENKMANARNPLVTNGDADRCECEQTGYFCSGVPGIIARIENGRLAPGATVQRCDACHRYASDDAAFEKLWKLGIA
jgi:hypothetical protein